MRTDDVDNGGLLPTSVVLSQNYLNPSNPSTTIKHEFPKSLSGRLSLCNRLGREVSLLANERKVAGVHGVTFDPSGLSSGVYFYRLQAGDFVATKRFFSLK
jgi:hypothetical protein